MLYLARFFCNFDRKIGHEIFVKTEKTNQLTYAYFVFSFPFFWISKMFQISGTATVKSIF